MDKRSAKNDFLELNFLPIFRDFEGLGNVM